MGSSFVVAVLEVNAGTCLPLQTTVHPKNLHYLSTKASKLGHRLENLGAQDFRGVGGGTLGARPPG
ncbi:MAG: hypothetical protein PW843_00185 [Azospirillaceae bacterium]|nr:hypothetical protein [Azospirillaceae bacterium]